VVLCEAYREADKDVSDFLIRVRAHRVRLKTQIKIVRSLVDIIDEEQQILFLDIFERIMNLLQKVTNKWTTIATALSSDQSYKVKVARTKYTIYFKTSLEAIMKSINEWHHDIDPLFYILMISHHERISQHMEDVKSDGTAATSGPQF
jgi:gas vesicle protein